MRLTDLLKGKGSPKEDTAKERNKLELQLEDLARQESHTVTVSVVEVKSTSHITYERGTDQTLIDKVIALPMELRQKHGWIGESYLEDLGRYVHPINLEITKATAGYGGLQFPREEGFYMELRCRSPFGLGSYGAMQLQIDLGRFSQMDELSAPKLICTEGNLTVRLFYRGDHQHLDEKFAKRMYEAFETVYEAVSVPAELNRRIEAAMKLSRPECPTQETV